MKVLLTLVLMLSTFWLQIAAQELNLFDFWKYYSDAQNCMYKTSCQLAFEQLSKREQMMSRLSTEDDYRQRQSQVREKLNRILGPLPEKTPLNARVTGVIKQEDYKVEKIIFESIPGYYVTAALFLPTPRKGKLPVVIYASGHTANGFRSEVYQHVIINLVKKGFAVFAFDPIGQGERWQYFNQDHTRRFKSPTIEHSYPGAQCYISGYSPTNFFVWDGVRSIDYLLTRKEIDPNRIGMTGRSGGGTQTAYTAAFDDRILAAAPECYITKMSYVLKSIGPQDAEQNLYRMIAEGLDHADLLEIRAPKPTLMITTTRDFFSIQGARETFDEVRKFYSGIDAAQNVGMVEDDAEHESTKKNREAMYAFFQKYLDNPGSNVDLEVEVFKEAELWTTETGKVASIPSAENLFSLNKKWVAQKVNKLDEVRAARSGPESLQKTVKEFSGFNYPAQFGTAVFSGRQVEQDYKLEKYLVPGGGDYQLPVVVYVPTKTANGTVLLWLDDQGITKAASRDTLISKLIEKGYAIAMADLPGIGSLGPGYLKGDAYIDNTSFNQWFAGILTGKSIVAMRAADIIRLTNFLSTEMSSIESVYSMSWGPLASELLHASLFESNIAKVALINPFLSYAEMALNADYEPAFITSVVAGAINAYDLPDIMAALNPRSIVVANPVDQMGEIYIDEQADKLLKYPSSKHQGFTLLKDLPQDQLVTQILSWLTK